MVINNVLWISQLTWKVLRTCWQTSERSFRPLRNASVAGRPPRGAMGGRHRHTEKKSSTQTCYTSCHRAYFEICQISGSWLFQSKGQSKVYHIISSTNYEAAACLITHTCPHRHDSPNMCAYTYTHTYTKPWVHTYARMYVSMCVCVHSGASRHL